MKLAKFDVCRALGDRQSHARKLASEGDMVHAGIMKLYRILSGLVLVCVLAYGGPVLAEPFEDGLAAYEDGDHSMALQQFLPLAEQGHAGAQFQLGRMYASGHGVPQDHVVAVAWFRLAAEQGNADAQRNLGIMYKRGRGVPTDYGAAADWFRLAAEQSDPAARSDLGDMYKDGRGVPQDYVLAHMWYSLAAGQDHEGAARRLRSVGLFMAPEQIAEAERLAREWKPKTP